MSSARRPPFPSGWNSIDLTLDDLCLRNTLPVGQTFIWHRHPLPIVQRELQVQDEIADHFDPAIAQSDPKDFTSITGQDAASNAISTIIKSEPEPEDLLPVSLNEKPAISSISNTTLKQENTNDVESTPEDEAEEEQATEEYSRIIPSPDRVLFLRQTSSKLYYTSLPSPPPGIDPHHSEPNSTSPMNLEELDLNYLTKHFQLPPSPLSPALTLKEQYAHWARLDPLVFGKSWERGFTPRGVRVCRTDPWECLVSFITSSANNVPRITSLLHKLCGHYSPILMTLPNPDLAVHSGSITHQTGAEEVPLDLTGYTEYRAFPQPSVLLADPDLETTLRTLGFGYRAKFIASSLELLVSEHGSEALGEGRNGTHDNRGIVDFLHRLGLPEEGLEVGQWRVEMIRLKGVGRKVADCIGLLSLNQPNVVPIDTHLQQIAARHPSFPNRLKGKSTSSELVYTQVQEFLTALWGGNDEIDIHPGNGYAGWAQAVMFAADLKGVSKAELGNGNGKDSPSGSDSGRKRKAEDGEEEKPKKSSKRSSLGKNVKTEPSTESAKGTKTASQLSKARALKLIPTLEAELLGSTYNPNPLIPLLSLARHPDPEVVHKSIWALYRVFTRYITDNRLQGIGLYTFERNTSKSSSTDESKLVKRWMEERVYEYADILAGLLRDVEPSLRKSGSSLIFSLLPALSENLSNSMNRPLIATAYLTYVLKSLVLPTVSLRGSTPSSPPQSSSSKSLTPGNNPSGQWSTVPENQIMTKVRASTMITLPGDVIHDASKKLADYDDLRWAVFKGFSTLIESYQTASEPIPEGLTGNILSLILPLHNLPQNAEDINEFYLPHLSKKPSKTSSSSKKTAKPSKNGSKPNAQSWMDFFESSEDESSEEEQIEIEVDKKTGNKKKRMKKVKVKKDVHSLVWSVQSQKKVFTDCWLALLGLPMTTAETRSILLVLHSVLFPNLIRGRVIRITDWLGGLCDEGGPLALLSLNGLFILMSNYNLEYPHFYRKLYGFMDREVLHVKYRARFFRLTETFLRSPLLPASLVASFVKRLARLSLAAPPSSAVMTIPFIYNMLKRHPSCMGMLHRPTAIVAPSLSDEDELDSDPYNVDEQDPLKTGAIDSSLWELKSLQRHYLSHVSTMGKIFEEVFTKPEFNLDDFLDHTYATLFETEVKRRLKNPPALALDKVANPFPSAKSEKSEDEKLDVIGELFTFG